MARALIDAGNDTPELRIELAAAAVLRKDRQAALDWFERAVEAGYPEYALIERDPILAEIRPEPRYLELLDRMKERVAPSAPALPNGLLDVTNLFEPIK